MPVVGGPVRVDVQRMGTVALVTFHNFTGHVERFRVTGIEGGDKLVQVEGNGSFRSAYTVDAELAVTHDVADGATLYRDPPIP